MRAVNELIADAEAGRLRGNKELAEVIAGCIRHTERICLRGCSDEAPEPHIPVIDRRHQTGGRFTRDQFRYEPRENVWYCPEGKPLRYRGQHRSMHGSSYCSTAAQCQGCPQKQRCTPAAYRKLFIHWYEPAREVARALVSTPPYEGSRRARYKIEALFAELKQGVLLRRVRLRRLWNVAEQFLMAATAQNLKRPVRFLAQRQAVPAPSTA